MIDNQQIKIYFGNVEDVMDDKKLNRIRISIPGKTEKLDKTILPWYYPILGMDFLPVVGDKVPVMIFDDNFTNGFYFKKIPDSKNAQTDFDGDEYKDYLEIFRRNGIQLTYNQEDGIQLINKNVKQQGLEDIYHIFIRPSENDEWKEGDKKVNHFKMTHNRFDLGTDGEATPLGDKTVAVLLDQLALSKQMYDNCMELFDTIKTGCGGNPILFGIKMPLVAKNPIKKIDPKPNANKLETDIKKIQSKKTFIE